ncbi:hypothetical protein LINPERPRIM_LOCUS15756 [Linum perenne]
MTSIQPTPSSTPPPEAPITALTARFWILGGPRRRRSGPWRWRLRTRRRRW